MRLTADDVPVVFHDPTLARATGGADARAVHQVAFADLPLLGSGERIPRLEDALDLLRERLVNVELKADVSPASRLGAVPQRLRVVRMTAAAVKRAARVEVVFSSFDPLSVVALLAAAPRIPRAILVGTTTPRMATVLPLTMWPAVVAAHLDDALLTSERIERLLRAGLRVAAWTVNDPARADALAALGVAWIISDAPGAICRRRT